MNTFLWFQQVEKKINLVTQRVEDMKSLISLLIEEGDKFNDFDSNGELREKAKQLGVKVSERV